MGAGAGRVGVPFEVVEEGVPFEVVEEGVGARLEFEMLLLDCVFKGVVDPETLFKSVGAFEFEMVGETVKLLATLGAEIALEFIGALALLDTTGNENPCIIVTPSPSTTVRSIFIAIIALLNTGDSFS